LEEIEKREAEKTGEKTEKDYFERLSDFKGKKESFRREFDRQAE